MNHPCLSYKTHKVSANFLPDAVYDKTKCAKTILFYDAFHHRKELSHQKTTVYDDRISHTDNPTPRAVSASAFLPIYVDV